MTSQWMFILRNMGKKLSIRAAFFAVLALVASLLARQFSFLVPDSVSDLVGGDAVDNILSIMASTMLMVVTFSLSTMVAAYTSATQNATPRSTTLIIEDSGSQNAISIFLGAFIYSIVSLIALSTDYYDNRGRVLLLTVTVAVLTSVVWKVITWMGELKDMGRVSENISRLEKVGTKAFKARARFSNLGCSVFKETPAATLAVYAGAVGYIQNIDINALAKLAEDQGLSIYIHTDIGAYTFDHTVIASIQGFKQGELKVFDEIRRYFFIGKNRTFENDPRYSVTVLSGVALHALSPSVNDPGTAIDVIGTLGRMLNFWLKENQKNIAQPAKYPRLFLRTLQTDVLFDDAFYAIASDASGQLSVILTLQEVLQAFTQMDDVEAARAAKKQAVLSLKRAEKKLTQMEDIDKLRQFTSSRQEITIHH